MSKEVPSDLLKKIKDVWGIEPQEEVGRMFPMFEDPWWKKATVVQPDLSILDINPRDLGKDTQEE